MVAVTPVRNPVPRTVMVPPSTEPTVGLTAEIVRGSRAVDAELTDDCEDGSVGEPPQLQMRTSASGRLAGRRRSRGMNRLLVAPGAGGQRNRLPWTIAPVVRVIRDNFMAIQWRVDTPAPSSQLRPVPSSPVYTCSRQP